MTVEKDTCDEIFWKSFNNQTPSHLSKNLLEAKLLLKEKFLKMKLQEK